MSVLLFLLEKEFRQIFRDRTILAMMLALPVVQLTILPLAADFEVSNINVALVDQDHSAASRRLMNAIASSGYFRVAGDAVSYPQALRLVEDAKADLVLQVPAGFERNLVREGRQEVGVALDAINSTRSSIGAAYLMSVIADYNRSLVMTPGMPSQPSLGTPPVIEVRSSDWFNPQREYKYYMVPGILVLLLTLVGGFMAALNIVREKEIGTIEQVNVSPIRKWQFILGKLIPFWIVGIVIFTLGLGVMYVVYGIFPRGSIAVLYLFAAVYLVALLGFGLLISTFGNTQLQAMFVAYFFMMIFMLMSGFFTGIDSMPDWARSLSELTPVTRFIRVVRLIVLKGSGLMDVRGELAWLAGFGLVLNAAAIVNYRKTG